jgi:phosphate acyltransferase
MRDDARRPSLDPALTGQEAAPNGAGPPGPAVPGGAIAVDAMGGDHGPAEIVAGAVAAHRNGIPVVLTGRPGMLRPLLVAQNALADVPVIPAEDVLTMSEGALASWRRPRSSIAVACQLVRRGQAAAVVSAGSTAGIVATARLRMHSVPGVSRPALAVLLPTRPSPTVLIDAGAIADPRPEMLVQFAQLGVAYTQLAHGIAEPRVGLLTIGAEPGKGNKLAKRAHELLAADPPHGGLPIGFIGNVEGTDLLAGKADVIVTDGFTGNVALKTLEGAAAFAAAGLRAAAGASPGGRLTRRWRRQAVADLTELADRLDPGHYGGAALLGLEGTVVIAHGAASARNITAAAELASSLVRGQITEKIRERTGHSRASHFLRRT